MNEVDDHCAWVIRYSPRHLGSGGFAGKMWRNRVGIYIRDLQGSCAAVDAVSERAWPAEHYVVGTSTMVKGPRDLVNIILMLIVFTH